MSIKVNHPASDIAFRATEHGHTNAAVMMKPDMTYELLTTGSFEQIVAICQRLLKDDSIKGIPLNRRIDSAGVVH
jgi:hypothetical protein